MQLKFHANPDKPDRRRAEKKRMRGEGGGEEWRSAMGYRGEEIKEQMRHQQRREQMCTATRCKKEKKKKGG